MNHAQLETELDNEVGQAAYTTLEIPERPVVDVDELFKEVALELGLNGKAAGADPPAPTIEFPEIRLHDQPVTIEKITDDIRMITEMQQSVTLSGTLMPEASAPDTARVMPVIDATAEPELHSHMDALYHPPILRDDRMKNAALIVAVLLFVAIVYLAWSNNALNPILPDGFRHVRPSVQEYIHGGAK
jgi:hypothetical protein